MCWRDSPKGVKTTKMHTGVVCRVWTLTRAIPTGLHLSAQGCCSQLPWEAFRMRGQPRRGCAFANLLSSGRPNPFRVRANIPPTQGSRVRLPWADGCNHFVVVRTKLLASLRDLAALWQDRLKHSSTHYYPITTAGGQFFTKQNRDDKLPQPFV